jgi:hypothetical protein
MAGIKGIIQSWSSSHHVGEHTYCTFLPDFGQRQNATRRIMARRLGVSTTSAGKKRTRQTFLLLLLRRCYCFLKNGWLAWWWKTILYYYSLVAGECVNDVSASSKRFKDLFSLERTRFRVCFGEEKWRKRRRWRDALTPYSTLLYFMRLTQADSSAKPMIISVYPRPVC